MVDIPPQLRAFQCNVQVFGNGRAGVGNCYWNNSKWIRGVFSLNDTPNTLKQIIGKIIKAMRAKQGLSQEDLAHECNVDRSYFSMIEVGRNEPSITKIFELCRGVNYHPPKRWRLLGQ
ncbi:helix-turn-helix domain-containing protein [Paenibacillus sp. FSL R7-0204]|uniref:helix-turn-helix domain-containing protein n=1 Tax=Paenibacillus sp. FSL R7-0204 TaxID=2921675 RepID=UPI004046D408